MDIPEQTDADGYDAELHYWMLVDSRVFGTRAPTGELVVLAMVMRDRKSRFADGHWIVTSVVMTPRDEIADGRVIETLNGRYLLVPTTH